MLNKDKMESSSEEIKVELQQLLTQINDDNYNGELSGLAKRLLSALSQHHTLAPKVCEILAALGRKSDFRTVACDHNVLPAIVPLLSSDDSDTSLQTMRAVGNICIDHDPSREAVLVSGGCPLLTAQLARSGQSERVKMVTCGCILNLCNDNEKLQTEMCSLGVVDGLTQVLATPNQPEPVLQMALQALNVVLEKGDVGSEMPKTLCVLLSRCCHGDIDLMEEVLELMEGLVNKSDKLHLGLVESGCVDFLLTQQFPALVQKANDIMVTLLSTDNCLDLLFNSDKLLTYVLANLSAAGKSHDLAANAALLLANMARTDANCKTLIERGVVPQLVALTKLEESKEMAGKLHHSALSALRNLSIPMENKPLLLKCGVADCALALLKTSSLAHVWFKALGVLRLLVDNQATACEHIVGQEGSLARVCEVTGATGPAQLKIEGCRLLAAIVKHSHNNDIMLAVVRAGGVSWVCSLLDSEHAVLNNEALVSLNLLAALGNDEFFGALCGCDLMDKLTCPLTSTSPEIVSNSLLLLEAIVKGNHDGIIAELKSSEQLRSTLSQLPSSGDEITSHRVTKLTSFIQ